MNATIAAVTALVVALTSLIGLGWTIYRTVTQSKQIASHEERLKSIESAAPPTVVP